MNPTAAVIPALVLLPAAAGAAAFVLRSDRWRRALLVATAAAHTALTAAAWAHRPAPVMDGVLGLDALGLLFLSITSALFLAVSFYASGYLAREGKEPRHDLDEDFLFSNKAEAQFTGGLLLFLATMSLVTVSLHLGLLWVALEATTLASAPLIYFHRHHRSLEATWKYLLVCSVGIALALLGNFFLAASGGTTAGGHVPLALDALLARGPDLSRPWVQGAFICLLVGYGTKMGLAPLHSWLPDAHSEAPSAVSALLSGALLNCAFLGILRALQVCAAAGLGDWARELLVGFGLLSMAYAAVFVLGQADYKRMLAYSSVEHMGILALGVGLGGAGGFGAMLHSVGHSMTKGMLFLLAGNVLAVYRTKSSAGVRGALGVLPLSGPLWVAGFLAIAGSPPFGLFASELTILRAALDGGRPWTAAAYLALLALVFVGMATAVLGMAQGRAPGGAAGRTPRREQASAVLPPAVLGVAVLLLGLHLPGFLDRLLHESAALLGGS